MWSLPKLARSTSENGLVAETGHERFLFDYFLVFVDHLEPARHAPQAERLSSFLVFLLGVDSKRDRVLELALHSHRVLQLHVAVLRAASFLAWLIIGLG